MNSISLRICLRHGSGLVYTLIKYHSCKSGNNYNFSNLAIGILRTAARSFSAKFDFKVGQRQIVIFTPDISIRSDSVNLGCKFVLFVTCTEVY